MKLVGVKIGFKNTFAVLLYLWLPFFSFSQQNKLYPDTQSNATNSLHEKQKVSYKIIHNNNGYGYDIFMNDALFIHQPEIPCIKGNKGFASSTDAKKVAILVISKITKGLIPPTITISEMEKTGVELHPKLKNNSN